MTKDEACYDRLSFLIKTLSNATNRKILIYLVNEGASGANTINDSLTNKLDRTTISKKLNILKELGFVVSYKDYKDNKYTTYEIVDKYVPMYKELYELSNIYGQNSI